MGVAGEQGSVGDEQRSEPYPMPPHPLNYNLRIYRDWARRAGIEFWVTPTARNSRPYDGRPQCTRYDTGEVCPTGAKYSPDFTFRQLLDRGAMELVANTLVRRLELEPDSDRIVRALAVDRSRPDQTVEFKARTFVVAAGYAWSSHLLLLSSEPRFPDGLANSSGLVGRHMAGHRGMVAEIEIPHRTYPGINDNNNLISLQFVRCPTDQPYVRHDLRIYESTYGRRPRLRDDAGSLLLGDTTLTDWRRRAKTGFARVRAFYDVIPSRDSRLTLDEAMKNAYGDPLARIEMVDHEDSASLREHTETKINALFESLVEQGGGRILTTYMYGSATGHPCGGCRMGADPATGVCDATGRTYDHENLFVVGAPNCVSPSCTNGTNTFAALALRSAHFIGADYPPRG